MIEFGKLEAVRAELVPLAPTFEFYRSILEFCQEPLEKGPAPSVVRGDGVDDVVVLVAVTQYVKLWRLAAAVVRLAQSGQAYEAEALIRAMYETSLLVEFVLRRQVRPRENGKRIEHGHRPFSSKFRARMYVGCPILLDHHRPLRPPADHAELNLISATAGAQHSNAPDVLPLPEHVDRMGTQSFRSLFDSNCLERCCPASEASLYPGP